MNKTGSNQSTSKTSSYALVVGNTLFLFAVFTVVWFCLYNRYFVLHYHEQKQLFQFDRLYFLSCLGQPGGLSGYLGSFLTQFYYYPLAGAAVIAAVLSAVFLLFYDICKRNGQIGRLFFIPFIPVVLLMASFVNIHFDMSYALGLLFALAGCRVYQALRSPMRYVAGWVLFTAVYFIAGGNALILTVLIIVFEIAAARFSLQKNSYLLLLLAWSVALPWLAGRMIYTVPDREAYFAVTYGKILFPTLTNKALWLSFPALYLCWRLLAAQTKKWNFSHWKTTVPNGLLTLLMTAYSAYSVYDRRAEMLNQMSFELQRGHFSSVMALGKDYPTKNRLACYLTNIALAESGQMPYNMFHYKQTGIAGLFLDWELSYFTLWYAGEIYYRLGMIPEAMHYSFEALVTSPKEPNAQVLRRLALTNMVHRDSLTADKYLRYFDHSLAYRGWAKQQRHYLASAMADTAFQIPDTPVPSPCSDFFITAQRPDYALFMLLESNPKHRMAFEYLVAYHMLQKDVGQVVWCLDNFFGNFDYQEIPTHYEEALMIYKNATQEGDDFFTKYPVSQVTRERFNQYVLAYKAAQTNKRSFELLQKQFGATYWYYIHFVEPSTLKKQDEQNRY